MLALPAWASFFRPGMRKPGKTFLYNAEPTLGLGKRHTDFACSEIQEGLLLFSRYVSQYFATPAEAALKQAVLSLPGTGGTERLSNLLAVTSGAATGLGTRTRILKSLHLNIESYFTLSSQ